MAIGAIASSLATLVCCLPVGLLGAAGGSAIAAFLFQTGRPWLLLLSFAFLGVGFTQMYRARRCGRKASRPAVILLSVALAVVLLIALFPQVIAGFLADWGN